MRGFWVIHMIAFGSHLSAFTDFSQIYDLVGKSSVPHFPLKVRGFKSSQPFLYKEVVHG